MVDLGSGTEKEAAVLRNLRAIKNDTGHGTLQVSVVGASESLILRAHSIKDLTQEHNSVTIHP